MNHLGNIKLLHATLGTGVTNGATVTANIDRLGYDFVALAAVFGTSNVVSNNPSTLKIGESDITDATGFSDITALVGDGVGGFVVANANTSVEHHWQFNIDCRVRKRYLRLTATPVTTQAIAYIAALGKADQNADASATLAGAVQIVNA